MLTCIARSKEAGDESLNARVEYEDADKNRRESTKTISSQLKGMALKATGAYKICTPCTGSSERIKEYSGSSLRSNFMSDRFQWSYRRTVSRLNLSGLSSGEETPRSPGSSRRSDPIVFVEESEPKEWVAQVEPGVLITFLSTPRSGNDIKRMRFSREMFNKWQAQRWWADNYDRVMELYNVQKSRQVVPLPTPSRSEEEERSGTRRCIEENNPGTPALSKERSPRNLYRPAESAFMSCYSSPDSLDHRHHHSSTSKLSRAKSETSSLRSSSSSRDPDATATGSDMDAEWVEQDEPGVYITVRALANGRRELRRVRFSREKYGEKNAREWWEENRARIHQRYL